MSITVLEPVPLTTVQDAGRVGYAAQGYRSCGAADSYAYRLANALVGNDPGAAVLESTLRGPALHRQELQKSPCHNPELGKERKAEVQPGRLHI